MARCSRNISILVTGLALALPISSATYAQQCGDPPRVDDQLLKGELDGKAQFLSSLVGNAGLRGQIEVARNDVLNRYPNADKVRSDSYMLYMFCTFVLSDAKLTAQEKFRAIQEYRQSGSVAPK